MKDPPLSHSPDHQDDTPPERPTPSRQPLQFPLARLMLVFTVMAAVGAPLAYLARALRGDRGAHFVFILLCLAVPTLLLVLISLLSGLLAWWKKSRRV